MNKLDIHLSSEYVDIASEPLTLHHIPHDTSLQPAHRLIVLVPSDSDFSAATPRLWELANALNAHVQLLGLCRDAAQEPNLRRDLVTMASMLRGARVSVDVNVEFGTTWIEAVKRNIQVGDRIVCFAEERAGLLHRPLSQILQSNIDATVYILSSLHPKTRPGPSWLSQTMLWTGSLAIIVIAFLLQVRIASLPQDWVQTTLFIVSAMAEVWLIWVWNSLSG